MTMKTVHILVVDDDEVDVKAVLRGFKELKIANPVTVARDGLEAFDALRGQNGREKLPTPYLILLDLNMPRMNGIEFLEALRHDPEHQHARVFVLTTSASDEDRVKAYQHHIAGYVLKNSPGHSFTEAVAMIQHFWRIIEFPVE